jgi:serine/threonine protein kinase
MNIAHRDFKPENIFITEDYNSNGTLRTVYKIGDFGFSSQKKTFNDVLGTYQYMAPEIFNREEYTSKVDVWSFGITIHQLLFNELYYSGKNKWEIEEKIKSTEYVLNE